MEQWMTSALGLGLGGLILALMLFAYVARQPVGNDLMRELAEAIQEGAMAFLRREYSVLVPFVRRGPAVLADRARSGVRLPVRRRVLDPGGLRRDAGRDDGQRPHDRGGA